jgi:DNA helicase HerA-like ATPase
MTDITEITRVVGVAPDLIQIEVTSTDVYESLSQQLEIGSYVKISDDNGSTVVAIVQSYRIKDDSRGNNETGSASTQFVIDTQPVGRLEDGVFKRGGKQITIPPKHVEIASVDVLRNIYASVPDTKKFSFGTLAQDSSVRVQLDGDKFFGKHIGVVGSTGSGKSSTVAKILQEGLRTSATQGSAGLLNNSHILIFDIHGEYSSAFPASRVIGVDDLRLPYWLMNSEELEEMFIESNEQNSHNQVSQFRSAVIENKRKHAGGSSASVSYDSPIYFSLREVVNYLTNLNAEMVSKAPGENWPKLKNGTRIDNRADHYFDNVLEFVEPSTSGATKATSGPFNGEFNRFLMRLKARQSDQRLDFLLAPRKVDNSEFRTVDLADLIRRFTGYGDKPTNVTIVDLSGIPFEVLSVVVALVTRLIFTFNFHFKKYRVAGEQEFPFLLVYEEAHNYVPQSTGAKYGTVRKSIERIAKEGRKYGISLMIVSQRPSEVSETVFSQCNNFVAMRLTNPADQSYVKRLLPDNLSAITDALPTLEQQEAIVIGDSVAVPSLLRVDDITDKPDSHDINFHSEWQQDWLDVAMAEVVAKWQA